MTSQPDELRASSRTVTLRHPNGREVTLNVTGETQGFIALLLERGCEKVDAHAPDAPKTKEKRVERG